MNQPYRAAALRGLILLGLTLLVACAAPAAPVAPTPAGPLPQVDAPTALVAPSPAGVPPRVGAVTADRASLGRYERIELTPNTADFFSLSYR